MQSRRNRDKARDLCSGPGKLTQALAIDGRHHGLLMAGKGRNAGCGLRPCGLASHQVVSDIRVGISRAVDYPWRFLARESPHVSIPYGRVKPPAAALRSSHLQE